MTRAGAGLALLALLARPAAALADDEDGGAAVVRGRRPGAGETVVHHGALENTGATTLADVLRAQGDVDVPGGGAPGGVGRFTLRGSTPDQVLLLVDGLRLNPRSSAAIVAGADPNLVPAAMLQRVSILRGPVSAIHGANAEAGAVALTTREPAPGLSVTGLAQTGVFASTLGPAGLSGRTQATLAGREGRSFAVVAGTANGTEGWAANTGAHLYDVALKVGRVLDGGGVAYAWVNVADAETGAPALGSLFDAEAFDADDRQAQRGVMAAGVYRAALSPTDTLEVAAAVEVARVVQRNPLGEDAMMGIEVDGATFLTSQSQLRVAWTRERGRWLAPATLGVELVRDALASTREGALDAGRASAFARDRVALGAFAVDLAARVDADTAYGVQVSPRAAVEWRAGAASRAYLAVGRGYRPPTFSERRWPVLRYARPMGVAVGERGNDALRVEHAWGVDAGAEVGAATGAWSLAVRAFGARYTDVIRWGVGRDGWWEPTNVPETWAWGVSVDAAVRLSADLRAVVTGMFQQTRDGATGEEVDGRLRDKVSARLVYFRRRGLRAWGEGLWFDRVGYDGLDRPWQGFLVNARAGYELWRGVGAFVLGENLLDARFESVRGLPFPGRTLWVGVSLDVDED